MINIVLVRNPVQPDRRERYQAEYYPMMTVQGYVAPLMADWPDTDFIISINGHVLEREEWQTLVPRDGDQIVMQPVIGKGLGDILRTVATMALMGWVSGITGTLGLGNVGNFILKGAAMYAGGRIINALLPVKQNAPSVNSSDAETTTTYSWSGAQVSQVPGTPVGKTFGIVQPELKLLMRHVTTDGSDQYLNLLYSAGEGPVDSLDNIKIDGNKIGNYNAVQYWTRLGTNDQDVIDTFSETVSDYSVSYELENDDVWHTQTTEGTAVEGLEIMVELPNGLYYLKDDSSLGMASAAFIAEYKLSTSSEWIFWMNPTISAAQNSTLYQTYRLDNLPPGQYDVRLRCNYKSGTGSRYSTKLYWVQLGEIIYDDFCYPGKVLLGVKIKATNQLSGGDPKVTCTVTRSTVWVWNPYNLTYEQKRASNPFWAAYDLIHNCKYLKNIQTGSYEYTVRGNAYTRIDYDMFKYHGDYADRLLPSGKYRFELNLFLDGNLNFWDALTRIAMVGRGVILPRGTKFSCICDRPGEVVQLFSMGNTWKSEGEFIGSKDRAKSVEATFWNREKNYGQDTAIYYSDEFNDDQMIPNPVQQTYHGITDYEHAYREAAFLGRCNEFKTRAETWEADIDAITCLPGDIVAKQSDVTAWGEAGGRLVGATATTVTLDKEVDLVAGTSYAIMIRLGNDTLVTKAIATVVEDTATDTLTVAEAFATTPEQYDVYAFGQTGIVAKPLRVISITKSKDQKCKLTGEEYFAEIYDDNVEIPVINYADFSVKHLAVMLDEVFPRPADGTANLSVSFRWPRDSRIAQAVFYVNGVQQKTVGLGTLGGMTVSVNSSGTHTVKVEITDLLDGIVATGEATYTIGPEYLADVDGDSLTSYYENNKLVIACSAVADYRVIQYEWRMGSTWVGGVSCGRTMTPKFSPPSDGTYWVAAAYGAIYSEVPQSVIVAGVVLTDNVLATLDEAAGAWPGTVSGGAVVDMGNNHVVLGGATDTDDAVYWDAVINFDYNGGAASAGAYTISTDNQIDIGTADLCNVGIVFDAIGDTINEGFDVVASMDALMNWDGDFSGYVAITPQIRTAGNDGVYGSWKNFYSGQYNARKFDFRVLLASTDPNVTAKLRGLAFTIDVPDRTESGTHILVSAEGLTVTYAKPFNAIPGPQVAVLDAEEGDVLIMPKSLQTKTGFWYQVQNGGVGVARYTNWTSQKY